MRPLVLLSSLTTGGAERVTVSFLARMADRGVPVDACTLTSRFDGVLARQLGRAGVLRHDLGARRLADPLAIWHLFRLLARERVDIVHAHGQDASILASLACSLARVRVVITRHVLTEPTASARQRLRASLALAAIARADAVIAVSEACARALCALVPKVKNKLRIIPNGIDQRRYPQEPDPGARAETRHEIGIGPAQLLVLLPAVLREGKGHDLLLRSLPGLVGIHPDIRVAFAGSGALEACLRMKAAPLGDRVLFLGERDDIPELLAACDLVVLPSAAEALPTVLIEAAAAGRPVVAARVGGVPEVVDHGRSGLLVPPDDVAALTSAISKVLGDTKLARHLGENGRQIAVERFGLDRMVEQTLDLWREVLRTAGR